MSRFVTALINKRRKDEGLEIAEERAQPDEEAHLDDIIASFDAQIHRLWNPGHAERGGNTKTHGIVRSEVTIRDDLPETMRHGIFAEPGRTYAAWVRYAGPGPYVPADIDDVGFMSMSIKLMGVPGPKLLEQEKNTQDFLGISTPTFVTPDTRANAKLQRWSYKNAQIYYFLNFRESHILDSIMQLLWTKTQTSPLEGDYFSCVPYLLGEGQAMQYSFATRRTKRTRVPRLPLRPPDNYLRDAMVKTLTEGDWEMEFMVQVQTDAHLMPIENACVHWPENLSPYVPVARVRFPAQRFVSDGQLAFADALRFNPWHSLAEHRPLGNSNRARRTMYWELAKLRQKMNNVEHVEPDGRETFS